MKNLLFFFILNFQLIYSATHWYAGTTSEGNGIGFRKTNSTIDSIKMQVDGYDVDSVYREVNTTSISSNATISNYNFSIVKVYSDTMASSSPLYNIGGQLPQFVIIGQTHYMSSSSPIEWQSNAFLDNSSRTTNPLGGPTWTVYQIGTSNTPSAPTSVNVSNSAQDLLISWGRVLNAYKYYVYRATSAFGSYSYIGTSDTTTFTDSPPNGATTYYYKVRAVNIWATSTYSSYDSGTTPPDAPAGLSLSTSGSGTIYADWSNSTGATQYILYRTTSYSGTYLPVDTVNSSWDYDQDLNHNTYYYYKVSAIGTGGESSLSTYQLIRTAPDAPTLSSSTLSDTQINLSIGIPTGSSMCYIERSNGSGYSLIDSTNSTTYSSTGLSPNTLYYYRLRCRNSSLSYGSYSSVSQSTTAPDAPDNPVLSSLSPFAFDISWGPSDGATQYHIQTWNGSAWDSIASTSSHYYRHHSSRLGSTRYYRIRSEGANGISNWGSYSSISPMVLNTIAFPYQEDFDTNLNDWSLYGNDSASRVELSTDNSPMGVSHLSFDRSNSTEASIQEAIFKVDIQSQDNMDLIYSLKSLSDEEDIPSDSISSFSDGDGVYISQDGSLWHLVNQFTSSTGVNSQWKQFYHDLDSLSQARSLGLKGEVYIKYTHRGNHSAPQDGITLDELKIVPKPLISLSHNAGGTTNHLSQQYYLFGDTTSIIIEPNEGYEIQSITVNGIGQSIQDTLQLDSITIDYDIDVQFSIMTYDVSISNSANGSSDPSSGFQLTYGSDSLIQFIPEDGYLIDSILINNVNVGSATQYQIQDISSNISIEAYYGLIPPTLHPLVALSTVNGSISPSDTTEVPEGGFLRYTFVPQEGFEIDSVFVDGLYVDSTQGYSFTNVLSSHEIDANFKKKFYLSHLTSNEHGSLSFEGDTLIEHGDSIQVSITPDLGYEISSIFFNGVEQTLADEFSIDSAFQVDTLIVNFSIQEFDVTIVTKDHGSSSLTGTNSFDWNESLSVYFTPHLGYQLDSIQVNGGLISGDSVQIDSIQQAYTIEPFYSEIDIEISFVHDSLHSIQLIDSLDFNGDSIRASASLDSLYQFDYWLINSTDTIWTDTLVWGPIFDHTQIQLITQLKEFNVNFSIVGNGSSSWPDDTTLIIGDSFTIHWDLFDQQKNQYLIVNNDTLRSLDSLFEDSISNHLNVTAYVTPDSVQFTYTIHGNGSISLLNSNPVQLRGDSVGIIFTPNANYQTDSLVSNLGQLDVLDTNWVLLDSNSTHLDIYFGPQTYNVGIFSTNAGVIKINGNPVGATHNIQYGDSLLLEVQALSPSYSLTKILKDGDELDWDLTQPEFRYYPVDSDMNLEFIYSKVEADSNESLLLIQVEDAKGLVYKEILQILAKDTAIQLSNFNSIIGTLPVFGDTYYVHELYLNNTLQAQRDSLSVTDLSQDLTIRIVVSSIPAHLFKLAHELGVQLEGNHLIASEIMTDLKLYNIQGDLIHHFKPNSNSATLPAGNWLIQINQDEFLMKGLVLK